MKIVVLLVAGLVSSFTMPAQAGLLDDLLKNPAIQALMNRGDLSTLVNACKDANYRRSNQSQCVHVENVLVINKLPVEMRAVMSNQQAANSLRELCSQAQNTPRATSYLCNELRKAESAIGINSSIPVIPTPQDTSTRDNDRG